MSEYDDRQATIAHSADIARQLRHINGTLSDIANVLYTLVEALHTTGIVAKPGTPTPRTAGADRASEASESATGISQQHPRPHHHHGRSYSESHHSKEHHMPTVCLTKKSHAARAAGAKPPQRARAGDPVPDFNFRDNEDSTITVFGTNNSGEQLDISGVATLTPAPTSSDATLVSVDAPSGMTFKIHGLKATVPGTPVIVTVTATWNDGSAGPFTFALPCDVTTGGPTGITLTIGPPVIRP